MVLPGLVDHLGENRKTVAWCKGSAERKEERSVAMVREKKRWCLVELVIIVDLNVVKMAKG